MHRPLMALSNGLTWIAGALVVAIMLITTVDVIGRRFLQQSIPGSLEVNLLLLVAVAYLGAAAAEWSGRHVEVVLLTSRLRGAARRAADSFRLTVMVLVLSVMVWSSAQSAISSYSRGEFTDGILGVTIWPAKAVIPLSFALYLSVVVVKALSPSPKSDVDDVPLGV